MMRKEFTVEGDTQGAQMFISGQGQQNLYSSFCLLYNDVTNSCYCDVSCYKIPPLPLLFIYFFYQTLLPGFFQVFVNGQRLGSDALAGAWTTYNARVLYYTYDVSAYLVTGQNVIASMIGMDIKSITRNLDALVHILTPNMYTLYPGYVYPLPRIFIRSNPGYLYTITPDINTY